MISVISTKRFSCKNSDSMGKVGGGVGGSAIEIHAIFKSFFANSDAKQVLKLPSRGLSCHQSLVNLLFSSFSKPLQAKKQAMGHLAEMSPYPFS